MKEILRSYGFGHSPAESASGVKVGYLIDEALRTQPTGCLQIATSDGTSFSMVRKLLGGLPSASRSASSSDSAPFLLRRNQFQERPVVLSETEKSGYSRRGADGAAEPTTSSSARKAVAPRLPLFSQGSHASDGKMCLSITAVRTVIPVGWQYRVEGTKLRQAHVRIHVTSRGAHSS